MMPCSERAAASPTGCSSQFRVGIVGAGLVRLLLAIVLRRADYHVVVSGRQGRRAQRSESSLNTFPITDLMQLLLKYMRRSEQRAVFRQWDPRIRTLVENGHGYLRWLLLDNSQTELSSWVHATPEDNLSLASVGDSAHTIGPYM